MDIFNVTFVLAAYIIWCVLSQLGYHYINIVYNISKHASSTIVLKHIPCSLSSTNVNMVKNVSNVIDRNNVFIFRTKTDIFKASNSKRWLKTTSNGNGLTHTKTRFSWYWYSDMKNSCKIDNVISELIFLSKMHHFFPKH